MTIDGLRDYLLINSLQYFIGADDIEVTDEVLQRLVKRALTTSANWRPLHYQSEVKVDGYTSYIKLDDKGRRILNVINLYFFEPIYAFVRKRIAANKENKSHNYELLSNKYVKLTYIIPLKDFS